MKRNGRADAETGARIAQQRPTQAMTFARQRPARTDDRAGTGEGAPLAQGGIGISRDRRRQAVDDLGRDRIFAVAVGDDKKPLATYLLERPWRLYASSAASASI